jgi:multisubunit Na+/H+ antiporter MnhG subunit
MSTHSESVVLIVGVCVCVCGTVGLHRMEKQPVYLKDFMHLTIVPKIFGEYKCYTV